MKYVKILAAVLTSIIALLILVSILLVWLIDPNDYKDYVTDLAEESTGRSLRIGDDLELSIFPWLAVETGDITIGNAAGFNELPFATIERASARVRLVPLLQQELDIGTIVLEGLQLNLGRDNDGLGNWEDLQNRPDAQVSQESQGDPSSTSISDFDIEGIRIDDSLVYWRENVDELRYVISGLDFESGSIRAGDSTDVSLKLELLDVEAQLTVTLDTSGEIEIGRDGQFGINDIEAAIGLFDVQKDERADTRINIVAITAAEDGSLTIGPGTVTGQLTDPPLGPERIDLSVTWQNAVIDATKQSLQVDGLLTEAAGIEASWELSAEALFDNPRLTASIVAGTLSLADALDTLQVTIPADIDTAALGDFSGRARIEVALDPQSITLDAVQADLLGMQVRGAAEVGNGDGWRASVDIPQFAANDSVRAILRSYLPASIDVDAFNRLAFAAEIDADVGSDNIAVSDINAEMLGATVTGSLQINSGDSENSIRGSIKSSRFAPDGFAIAFAEFLSAGIDPGALGMLSVDTSFDYDLRADSATLSPFSVEIFGLTANGELTANSLSSSARYVGRAHVDTFPPRVFLNRFGQAVPQTSDDTALSRASIDARFQIDDQRGQFDDISVVLDDSSISGNFMVENFQNPSFSFNMSADHIDVDRYLPPQSTQAEEGERVAGDIELSSQATNFLRIRGQARVGDLTLAGMEFQEVSTSIAIGDGRADLDSAYAKLYGGEFSGSLNVDTNGAQASMRLSGQATELELEPLITAMAGDANFSGTGSFDLDLSGRGATVTENLASAGGEISFALRDGVINGFNLGRTICAAFNAADELAAPTDAPNRTQYSLIQGAATVSNGIATSPQLLARTPFMDITGSGQLILVDQQLDYDLDSKLTNSIEIDGCQSMDQHIGGSIPWTLSGTVTDVSILPDFGKLIRERAKEEVRDSLRDRLEDRLRDLL